MKILEVSRYKDNFATHQLPFVTEQGESLRAAGCEVDYFLVRGNYITAVRALKQKIREHQPDIVHAHYGLSGVTASLACKSCPLITTFHNGETLNWKTNLTTSLFSLQAKHVIYVAQHIYDLCYFKHKHYTILPCGVNMEESKPTDYLTARQQLSFDANTKYILFGGAFANTRKNVALLREAISRLIAPSPNRLSPIEIIEMKGMDRRTVALYMSACDLFALPTHSEGSPQALKEAMACNCPIVATDCADIAHLLGDLEGHYLLRNPRPTKERWDADERSVDEMTALLKSALSLPSGFRTHGRDRIIELGYTNELVAEKLIQIYQKVLKK